MDSPHSPSSRPFRPGSNVAVIGAGISGVCSAAHLLRECVDVTVFERGSVAGGIWHFDPRVCDDPSYPSETPSVGDYVNSSPGQFAYQTPAPEPSSPPPPLALPVSPVLGPSSSETRQTLDEAAQRLRYHHALDSYDEAAREVSFAPPGPCYAGLRNNVPTSLMVSSLAAWPPGTADYVSQATVERYVQDLACDTGVDAVTRYHTRVEDVHKVFGGRGWLVRTLSLEKPPGGRDSRARLEERTWEFDAVVVASGHYNLPRVPDIPGLAGWKARFGGRVIHSKQYRAPERYRGRNVLVIGAGVSALDICRELGEVAVRIWQSARGGKYDLPATWLPVNGARAGEIAQFELHATEAGQASPTLDDSTPIPGRVVLKDGSILEDVHHVILATGYITSYPFLPKLHSDTAPVDAAGHALLVTADGDMAHNLHRDIFYIPDPTLAFVGTPYHVSTFSLFDFQAQIVARVLSGRARLPPMAEMRAEYEDRVRRKGLGRAFHSLREGGAEARYVKELVEWANRDADLDGTEGMKGLEEEWLETHRELKQRIAALRDGATKEG